MKAIFIVIALLINNLAQAQTAVVLEFQIHSDNWLEENWYDEEQFYQIQNNRLVRKYEKVYFKDKMPKESKADSIELDSQQIQQVVDFLKKEKEQLTPYALCRARTSLHIALEVKIEEDYYLHSTYAPCRSMFVPQAFQDFKKLLDEMGSN